MPKTIGLRIMTEDQDRTYYFSQFEGVGEGWQSTAIIGTFLCDYYGQGNEIMDNGALRFPFTIPTRFVIEEVVE